MNHRRRPFLLLAALVAAGSASAQSYRDNEFNALEMSKMPKYCYSQFLNDKLRDDPQYSIQGCGPFVNHFCPAILALIRAEDPKRNAADRRRKVEYVYREVAYTLNKLPDDCWLRPDIEAVTERAKAVELKLP